MSGGGIAGILMIFLLVIVLFIAASCVKIVPQASAYVVESLGKYKGTWATGLHFKVPFIERVAIRAECADLSDSLCVVISVSGSVQFMCGAVSIDGKLQNFDAGFDSDECDECSGRLCIHFWIPLGRGRCGTCFSDFENDCLRASLSETEKSGARHSCRGTWNSLGWKNDSQDFEYRNSERSGE